MDPVNDQPSITDDDTDMGITVKENLELYVLILFNI